MWRRIARIGTGDTMTDSPLQQRLRRISAMERREEARAFLNSFHDASGASADTRRKRWADVRRGLSRDGFYEHTPDEIAFGARLAWRNNARCIGRLFWESLDVVDCRHLTQVGDIAGRMHDHLRESQSDGRIKSVISIFAPVRGKTLPAWIESPQISQYACHSLPDGTLLGDRQNMEATRIARAMGWAPASEPSRFDLLPWFIRDAQDRRHCINLPQGAVREIPITHPGRPELEKMGLRWYSVPIVSGMIMTIGGIEYPCAPFNGFYMGTEIASRNFADAKRYDLLAEAAVALGLDPAGPRSTLWRDTALTELNRAVLQSFRAAGVTMVDHHTASDEFMTFHNREQAAGRRVAADWRWIVPPQAAAASDAFHLRMRNFHPVPNYYNSRGGDGLQLMPWYGDRHRRPSAVWTDRIMRRWKIWKRMAW
jgi:nitric-oxide synthase